MKSCKICGIQHVRDSDFCCKACYHKQNYIDNREKINAYNRQYKKDHLFEEVERNKKHYQDNKEEIRSRHKKYNKDNRDRLNAYQTRREKEDINFKLKRSLRSRLRHAIINNQKIGSAVSDLGCTIDFLKQYIESKWQGEMSWDNWGTCKWGVRNWQIDHIIPLASFDLTNMEQFKKANHYTNLQPLWWQDNLSKRDDEL